MFRIVLIFLYSLCGLAACNIPIGFLSPSPNQNHAPTVNVLTQISTVNQETQNAYNPQVSNSTLEATSVLLITPTPPAGDGVCNRAVAGLPIDVTIPDGTTFRPGQPFEKIWRLVNSGSCAWDQEYAIVWFSGETMGAGKVQGIRAKVFPGQSIDIVIDMIAPDKPGVYQSNWKLRSPDGSFFGIGPAGDAPIWVRIVVEEEAVSPTAGLVPSLTSTSQIYRGGEAVLYLEDRLDLDSGLINSGSNGDLIFQRPANQQPLLMPQPGTRLVIFGSKQPSEKECQKSSLSATPINLENLKEDIFLCFKSNQGLPGYIRLKVINLNDNILHLEFVTWSIP